MKTILFAWEFGAGAGHLVNIRRLAQRLQRDDIRLVAAVRNLDSVEMLDNIREIHRMPNWPKPGADIPRSSATMTEMLVDATMNDAAVVQTMLGAWDRLFQRVKPSLVIADYAPGASLAARGRIPLMHIGSGFTLPPHDMERYPVLHDLSPVLNRDDDTLAAINEAVRRLGMRTLERLPQVFEGDARLVYVLPLIDPYVATRKPPADGPMIDYTPRARHADARDVFVYISADTEVRADVLAALRPVARHVRINAPRLPEQARRELAQAGARIETGYVALSEALLHCRLVVHLGGSGFANEAALAGVPQLTLTTHVERYLHGVALEQAGIGRNFPAYDAARELAADTVAGMFDDEALHRRAEQTSLRLRAERTSAGDSFDRQCRRLLG